MLCIGVFELELIFVFVARMSPSQGLYGMTVWGEMDIAQVLSRTPVLRYAYLSFAEDPSEINTVPYVCSRTIHLLQYNGLPVDSMHIL